MSFNTNCSIIGVVGGKGGTGKSIFAANFAIKIGMELKTPTLLIDADHKSCGDQNFITGLSDPKTLEQLCAFSSSISAKNLPAICSIHTKAPLHYIASVKGPGQISNPSPSLVMKQLAQLTHLYKFVVIDLGNDFEELQHKLMEACTAIVVVTTPEVLTINQTIRVMNELRASGTPLDMIQVVLNKSSNLGLSPQNIEQSLRKPLLGIIPQDDITTSSALKRSEPFMIASAQTPIGNAYTEILRKLTGGVLQGLKNLNRTPKISFEKTDASTTTAANTEKKEELSNRDHLKILIHKRLIKEFESMNKNIEEEIKDPEKKKKLEVDVRLAIAKILEQEGNGLPAADRKQITEEVLDEALGLGPLEALLADKDISEIMVNGYRNIFFEKKGLITKSSIHFTADQQLENIIQRIVMPLGRQINSKTPYVDARLADGSRVHAIIKPLAIDGAALTIRKFKKDGFGEEQYIHYGSATKQMMQFLRIAVEHGCNIIISGGTGSGKTTLLNCMSSYIPPKERIITVEDAAELQLRQQHVVRLETRPANSEGAPAVTIRDLVRNTLRMRPDRIVVGECRDGAALDMLAAMSTGHDGSMTTVHANNPREAVGRLETLCLMAGMDLPVRAIREQIASAVDFIVQISRLSDGSRKILSIAEIQGMQDDKVTILPVFEFQEKDIVNGKIIGQFFSEGLIPKFVEDLRKKGVDIPKDLFTNDSEGVAASASQTATQNAAQKVAKPTFAVKKAVGSK